MPANPASIIAQVEGSGTCVTVTPSARSSEFIPSASMPETTDNEKMSKNEPALHLKVSPTAPQARPSSDSDLSPLVKPSPAPTISNVSPVEMPDGLDRHG
jgi:hypothetical protein